jgi:hypothetical protein
VLGNLNFGLILMDPTKRRDKRKSSDGFGARLELLAVFTPCNVLQNI